MADVQVFEPEFNEIFTDRGWRAAFAGRTGIVCDTDGSAFGLTKPPEGSTVEIGSPTIPSRLVVDGFGLEVPAATSQSLSVPASSGGGTAGRTDLIVGRLTTGPTNLELYRIQGTEGSTALPAASYNPTGTRDLLLYAIRRIEGEGLNEAIVTDLRSRIGHHHLVPAGASLPANAPLGDTATRAGTKWRRDVVGSAVDWVQEWSPPNATGVTVFDTGWVSLIPQLGWEHVPGRTASVRRVGTSVGFRGAVRPASGNPAVGTHTPARVPSGIGCRPTAMSRWSTMTFSDGTAVRVVLGTDGLIQFVDLTGAGASLQVDACGFTTD
jgi:hypothetical protein